MSERKHVPCWKEHYSLWLTFTFVCGKKHFCQFSLKLHILCVLPAAVETEATRASGLGTGCTGGILDPKTGRFHWNFDSPRTVQATIFINHQHPYQVNTINIAIIIITRDHIIQYTPCSLGSVLGNIAPGTIFLDRLPGANIRHTSNTQKHWQCNHANWDIGFAGKQHISTLIVFVCTNHQIKGFETIFHNTFTDSSIISCQEK